jgi:hypothetical protein
MIEMIQLYADSGSREKNLSHPAKKIIINIKDILLN